MMPYWYVIVIQTVILVIGLSLYYYFGKDAL